jgi:hypothetical protein
MLGVRLGVVGILAREDVKEERKYERTDGSVAISLRNFVGEGIK